MTGPRLNLCGYSFRTVSPIDGMDRLTGVFNAFMDFFKEMLCFQEIGFLSEYSINYPTWYISSLIICSYFVYSIVKTLKNKAIEFVLPLIIIILYTSIFKDYGNLDVSGVGSILSMRFIRGFASISLGVILGYIVFDHTNILYKLTTILNILGVFSLLSVTFIMFNTNTFDMYSLILFPIILLALFNEKTILCKCTNYKIFKKLGELSLGLLLTHATIGWQINQVLRHFEILQPFLIPLYLGGCIFAAYVFDYMVNYIDRKWLNALL